MHALDLRFARNTSSAAPIQVYDWQSQPLLAKQPFPNVVVPSVGAALLVHARQAGIPLEDPVLEGVERAVAELRSAIAVAQTG